MKPLLHLVSIVLVLPGVALAVAFIVLGRAIAAQSLVGLLFQLLSDALWIVPWGLLAACTGIVAVAIAGLRSRTRWIAGLCVALLGIGSTLVLVGLGAQQVSADSVLFLLPGAAGACIGLWFAWTERPRGVAPLPSSMGRTSTTEAGRAGHSPPKRP